MFSRGLCMKLRPGCYAEYKRYHDELWPELAKSMSDNDVSMAIFRHGDRLFLHTAAPSEEHWARSRNVDVLDKWHEVMKALLETDENGEIIFDDLETAFEFGIFKD